MNCPLFLIFLLWHCFWYTTATPLHFLPPPLLVMCTDPQHRVYQRHDNELHLSCLWDGKIDLKYSRKRGLALEIKGTAAGMQAPHCQWYQDSNLVKNTNHWSGQVVVDTGLDAEDPHPPWVFTHVTMQCISAWCHAPTCAHNNLTIEVSRQDVRFFLLSPQTLPIREWQPVQLGWCTRLKSSTWSYRFKSPGGSPADFLIPSNHHNELLISALDPYAELHQICVSYYKYHVTVRYPHRGLYTASLQNENGPQLRCSLNLYVQPALLHVFSASSTMLSLSHRTLNLSWTLQPLSPRIMAYSLIDVQGRGKWFPYYNYNPFAQQSDFCSAPKLQNSRDKVMASIYFRTSEKISGQLKGEIYFFNQTVIFKTNNAIPTYLTLNPQKTKAGTYIFSHALGLYYSFQENKTTNATGESSSYHYIFYEQQSLSYLLIIEFMQLQWYRFSMHLYLNRRETLFKALGEKDMEVQIFNGRSTEENLVYILWFIPIQHPQQQCEWVFDLKIFDSRKKHLLWNSTYTYENRVKNAAHLLPNSVSSFKASLYAGFVAEVNCRKNGLAQAVLKATVNTYYSKIMEPTVACQKSYCYELKAVIHKPDLFEPVIRYKRRSTISLQATAKAECRTHSVTHVLWKIYTLKTALSIPDWANPLKLPNEIETDRVMFYIPGNVLYYGFHYVNVTVTVFLPAYNINITESDSVLLQILESDLVANIIGGLFRTVGVSDRWALDGSTSSDPDSHNPLEGITFNWYCSKRELDYSTMKLSPGEKCHSAQVDLNWSSSTDPVQRVEPNTLQENTKYYFILIILKQNRSAHTPQTVHVLPGSVPMVNIICFENCAKAIKVTEHFVLSARCLNCEKTQTIYLWTLLSANSKEIQFDWASKTTTGRSNPYININPLAFRYMADTFYTLSLKVNSQGRSSGVCTYSFYVNAPPQPGKCNIYPKEGTAFLTKFVIQCTGFEDKNGPLTYKVIARSDLTKMTNISSLQNNTFGTIVYTGYHHKTPPSFLPSGTPSKKYVLDIYIQVYDAYGVFSQLTLQATVHDPTRSMPTDILLNKLHGLISRINSYIQMKDYINIGFHIYIMSSVLNDIEASPLTYDSKNDLWEILFNVSSGIPMTEVGIINQIVSIICQITQDVNKLSRKLQLLAVRKLKEASEALKRHRDKDLGSKEAEVIGNGIFTGLSNVLRASLLNRGNVNRNAIKETIQVTEIVADLVLQGKVPGEHETSVEAKDWSIHLQKNEKWKIFNISSQILDCRNCFYPKLKQENHTELPVDAVVSTVRYIFDENPFPWLANSVDIRTVVTGFKMVGTKASGDTGGINPEVVEVIMARKDKKSAVFNLTIGPDKKLYKTTGGFNTEIKTNSKHIFIQILCDMTVTFTVSIYLGLNVSHVPVASYIAFPDKDPIPHQMDSGITDCPVKAPYILCLPQSLLGTSSQSNRGNKWNISVVIQSDPIVRRQTTKVVRIAVFTAECLDLNGIQNQWEEGTCSLGPYTSRSKIHCICEAKKHNTATTSSRQLLVDSDDHIRFFAGKFVLYPNPLDINKVLLAEFDANPVPLFTVFSIFAGYIFCTTWAMIKDKADLKRKNKILVLPDNDPYHKVRYLVTTYTGSRLGSGTTADVFLQLIGQNGVSDIHHIKHPQFPTFSRASVDTFLLTTKYDLGDILSLHVWHNNSGSSPNWYLSRVKVYNVQTKQSWLFICRNWLGLGKADGKIQRSFVAQSQKSVLNKMDYFLISLARDLEETHIWLSVFSQVATGSFTRVQRVSCCLVIMLTTLLFNIMFFSGEEEKELISVRHRYLKSIYIGFVSALFSIPVQLTITLLFKYSKEKPSVSTRRDSGLKTLSSLSENFMNEDSSSDPETSSTKAQHVQFSNNANNNDVTEKDTGTTTAEETVHTEFLFFFETPQFSWWWKYVAWALVFIISGISACLIILYGLTYGYTTSMEWFIASMTSFFESVFLLQTLKMGLISAISTITLKYCENIPWKKTEQYQQMKLVQIRVDERDKKKIHNELVRVRRTKAYEPLIEDEVIVLRKKVRAQHLAFVFVKDIICHLLFSSCILAIAYSTEPTNSFYYNKAIYNKFSPGLSKINKLEHIYIWMSNVFVPLIHNDYQPTYLSESWSKILGLPRMRQVRAQNIEKACFPAHNFANTYMISKSHCRPNYNTDPEDQSDYLGSWDVPTNRSISNNSNDFQGFTYQSDIDQWEYKSYGVFNAYGPGGYSFYFFPREQRPNTTLRLNNLQRNSWLDERTWAVIFELTTFNPDVDLYCSITVMFETTDMGVVNASLSVHSYKLSVFHYESNSQLVVYGIIVYILVFYLADEFHMLRQQRIGYLKTATNLNNFAIKTICMFFILLIALKFKLAFTLLEFHLLNPEEFVPFHVVSQIDQLYRMVTGVLAFLLVLKPYRYFRFLYKMRLAEKTLSAAFPGFVYMTMFTAMLFFTYMSFGYLIFGENEWNYNSLIHSLQTIVSYCSFGLKKTGIITSDNWLGIFFRASFMFIILFIFLNFWKALIITTYTSMKQPVYEQHSDEAEAINFVVWKIRRTWLSITQPASSASDSDVANTVIFGKPTITADNQRGLRTTQVNGKEMVYLSV
ncbi:polycystic kidney disease and receptor for egg jelly-related protein-like [Sceloporus undulatus]|uniref:polycystic kidney disease and receptor for egg jelly-related protein-like n=1 Tax=Sceloporus undulatus TaxID=8520 RepID=UPI001C4AD5ED|nr:polycystic kidney disease and receptor for egg jelly-related protein-like [Sceloporus undulatus]